MKWTGNSLRLRHLHLQGWENLMIKHNIAQPKQMSVITVGVACLKWCKLSVCILSFSSTQKLNYTPIALYNHWPQKSVPSLESTPFLATCFSCLSKPVLLCSSSLKMFDNAVNGASKPKFCKADTLHMDISDIYLRHVGVRSFTFP